MFTVVHRLMTQTCVSSVIREESVISINAASLAYEMCTSYGNEIN